MTCEIVVTIVRARQSISKSAFPHRAASLAHLWRLDFSATQLMEIGATLGADVPFFFVGGRALATGIGTEVKALPDNPKKHLLVVTPNATVSTAEAYKWLRAPALTTSVDASILSSSCSATEFRDT